LRHSQYRGGIYFNPGLSGEGTGGGQQKGADDYRNEKNGDIFQMGTYGGVLIIWIHGISHE
jgi:hypothetical protein